MSRRVLFAKAGKTGRAGTIGDRRVVDLGKNRRMVGRKRKGSRHSSKKRKKKRKGRRSLPWSSRSFECSRRMRKRKKLVSFRSWLLAKGPSEPRDRT